MTIANDDFPASTETTGRLIPGASATGRSDASYDKDWFKISLEAGKNYLFSTTQGTELGLFKPDGSQLNLYPQLNMGSAGLPTISYRPQVAGDYYVQAGRYEGEYTVSAREIALDDYAREAGTIGVLTPGATVTGTLESSTDLDEFSMPVTGGLLYRVTRNVSGKTTIIEYAPETSGKIDFTIGYGSDPGKYTLSAAIVADDLASDTSTTGRLALGGASSVNLEIARDSDWFAINLDPGSATTFTAAGMTAITIHDANGVEMMSSRNTSNAGALTYSPTKAGVYYAAVSSYAAGTFALTAVSAKDDISNLPSTYPTLETLGQFNGRIDYAGDKDHVTFVATAGNYYTISLSEKDSTSNSIRSIISQSDGTVLPMYGEKLSTFKAESSGSYLITLDTQFGSGKQYTLTSSAPIADDAPNLPAGARTIAVDSPVNGMIEAARDRDFYKIYLEAGTTYKVEMDIKVAVGHFTDAADTYLARPLTPEVSGFYYVSIDNIFRSTGAYAFTVTASRDAISGDASTTARLNVGGASQDVVLTASDTDWFAISLEAGKHYVVDLARATGTHGYPKIRILDAQGASLDFRLSQYSEINQAALFTAPLSGTYYISLSATTDSNYKLTAAIDAQDDHGDDSQHATLISPGQAAKGTFESGWDTDVMKIHLQPNTYYSAKAWTTTPAGTATEMIHGSFLRVGTDSGSASWRAGEPFKVDVEGDYTQPFIRSQFNNASTFNFQVVSIGKDDHGNTAATATRLDAGASIGTLEFGGDIDKLAAHLKKNTAYTFELHNLGDAADVHRNPLSMEVMLDGRNLLTTLVAQNGNIASTTFAAFIDGDYTFSVGRQYSETGTPYFVRILNHDSDKTAPVVAKFHPALASAGLPLFDDIVIDFSENMLRDTGTIKLLDHAGNALLNFEAMSDTRLAINSKTLTLSNDAPLYPGASYTLAFGEGSLSDRSGNDLAAATFSFTAAAAKPAGDGDDLLAASGSGASIDGGQGRDTLYYQGAPADYQVRIDAGTATVGAMGGGARDTLVNVERLLFTSGDAIALDVGGVAGGLYRLYQAAFDRTPDKTGAGYWLNRMDQGTSLRQAATEFISSSEFQKTYGANLDNAAFVTQLYQNVLHRAGDASGVKFWNEVLAAGEPRANVLVGFSESVENQAATAELIANGFTYVPYWL